MKFYISIWWLFILMRISMVQSVVISIEFYRVFTGLYWVFTGSLRMTVDYWQIPTADQPATAGQPRREEPEHGAPRQHQAGAAIRKDRRHDGKPSKTHLNPLRPTETH